MTQSASKLLIIGAGQAAFAAISELQRLNFDGTVLLVGNEAHLPYERPPLSKEVLLKSDASLDDVSLQKPSFYSELNIEPLLGTSVTALDTEKKTATLSDGQVIAFDKCLIATGCSPRTLPGLDCAAANIHYFRSWDDALKLKKALNADTRLGIIGGGFLGLELASTARTLGCQVALFERSDRLLPRHAPTFLSDWLIKQAQHQGIALHCGVEQLDVVPEGGEYRITAGDTSIQVNELAVMIGSVAGDQLARQANIAVHPQLGGIVVDGYGRTQHDDIFAAGDCTTQIDADNQAFRLESWQNANEQGRRAASLMAGVEPSDAAFPWFWTDVFGSNIQMLGAYQPDLQYFSRGELSVGDDAPQSLSIGVKDNVIHHAIALNAARDLRPLRKLLEEQTPVNTDQFIDPDVSMREFSKSALSATQQAAN
ncbi:MAG TPA: FAD-dependent oxidoreductase [Paenalcaligenes sp.]|nr:FAD-dependent oxidoreductase [Paenalcaligenes sp.]